MGDWILEMGDDKHILLLIYKRIDRKNKEGFFCSMHQSVEKFIFCIKIYFFLKRV